MASIDTMTDEEELHKLLSGTENFDERKKIRARLKQIREEKSAEWEKARAERDACHIDVTAMRLKQAQEQKERDIKCLEDKAKEKREKTTPSLREEGIRMRQENAAKEKAAAIQSLTDRNKMTGDLIGKGTDRGLKEALKTADEVKHKKMEEAKSSSTRTVTGKDGVKTTTSTTTTKKSAGTDSGKNAFKQLDAQSGGGLNPEGSPVSVQRSPSTIKAMLLEWCKRMTAGYEHVNITNFSTSWNDGMAFCALIHHFYPRAFDYSKLKPKFRRGNFKLAFEVSEKLGGVAPLLDIEDMVRMKNPDWKCVFTYVQQFYGKFRNWEEQQAEKAAKEGEAKEG